MVGYYFFFQAEDGIRDGRVTGVQTCALPISVKRGVKHGGIALVIVHLVEPGHEESRFSVQPGELEKYFEGWDILHYYEGRSEERRVGKECRSEWSAYHEKESAVADMAS